MKLIAILALMLVFMNITMATASLTYEKDRVIEYTENILLNMDSIGAARCFIEGDDNDVKIYVKPADGSVDNISGALYAALYSYIEIVQAYPKEAGDFTLYLGKYGEVWTSMFTVTRSSVTGFEINDEATLLATYKKMLENRLDAF